MGRVNYAGLVVAGIGFFLTRYTVSLSLYESATRFYLTGVVPLAMGLALAAFGVALAVGDVAPETANTTALWCVIGTATMLLLVVLAVAESFPDVVLFPTVRVHAALSNVLIGASVGGTMTGLYAARSRRHREELRRQANRLETLNRLLRHDVLNAVTVVRGYATLAEEGSEDATRVIAERAEAIEGTIEEVKHLTRRTTGEGGRTRADLGDRLSEGVATLAERHPEASVSVGDVPAGVSVRADDRLAEVLTELLENAVVHGGDDSPAVEVSVGRSTVRVSVRDDGPGLPERQRRLLERGDIEEFDDPRSGFGLNLVRLFVESYDGEIETRVDAGTTVTLVLRRAPDERTGATERVRLDRPQLTVAFGASLLAGGCYGVTSEALGGSVAGIGTFYGLANPAVGWLTHEFHSAVFAFVFVALLSLAPERYHDSLPAFLAVGAGWALALWVVAAGLVAPVWLRLLGIPAAVPHFEATVLASHLVWGLSLGALTALGFRHVAPRLARLDGRAR